MTKCSKQQCIFKYILYRREKNNSYTERDEEREREREREREEGERRGRERDEKRETNM